MGVAGVAIFGWFVLLFVSQDFALEHGTAAVLIRTEGQVLIEADSKSVNTHDGTVTTICKIDQFDDIVVVSAGVTGERSLGFELKALIATAATAPGTLSERIDLLDKLVVSELERVMTKARELEPEWFRTHYEMRGELLAQIAFVSAGTDPPEVNIRQYRPVPTRDRVNVHAEPVHVALPGIGFLGDDQAMYPIAETQGIAILRDPANGARTMVEAAARANPAMVGLPVRIVRVRPNDIEWLSGQSGCK